MDYEVGRHLLTFNYRTKENIKGTNWPMCVMSPQGVSRCKVMLVIISILKRKRFHCYIVRLKLGIGFVTFKPPAREGLGGIEVRSEELGINLNNVSQHSCFHLKEEYKPLLTIETKLWSIWGFFLALLKNGLSRKGVAASQKNFYFSLLLRNIALFCLNTARRWMW